MAARNAKITFGLLSFNVKLSGAKDKPVEMKNLCVGQPEKPEHAPAPLKQPKVCEECGPITDFSVIVKGVPNGHEFTIITQEEVAEKKAEFADEYKKELVLVPHPATEFLTATGPGESLNYVTPADVSGEGIYQLLLKLVTDHPEVCLVALYTPVSVTSLFMLTVRNGALVLEQRTRTQDLKAAPSVGGEVNESLYGMLEMSLQAMLTAYNPADYEDGYKTAVRAMAEARSTVTEIGTATSVPDVEADLREKLQAMMQKQGAA